MRKFCLVLCLSLLSSLFQAVAMPVNIGPAHQTQYQTQHLTHHESHDCEGANATPTSKTCHMTGHLCCLGITSAITTPIQTHATKSNLLNPVFLTLVLQDHPNPQFKPPKQRLQS